jgi:hypothetical protein
MSTPFGITIPLRLTRRRSAVDHHQSNSLAALLSELLRWNERSRQRAALRDLADDPVWSKN